MERVQNGTSIGETAKAAPTVFNNKFSYQLKERKDAQVLILLEDHLTTTNANRFRTVVQELVDKNKTRVILNLRNVEYMDSTGLGALIGMSETLRYRRGNLVLMNVGETVKKMLAITQMTELFAIVGD